MIKIDISPETMGIILLISWTVMLIIGIVRVVIWWRARKSNENVSQPANFN